MQHFRAMYRPFSYFPSQTVLNGYFNQSAVSGILARLFKFCHDDYTYKLASQEDDALKHTVTHPLWKSHGVK